MKIILIISFTDLGSEPRVNRQIEFLKDRYKLIVCGRSSPKMEGIDFIPVEVAKTKLLNKLFMVVLLFFRHFEAVYWRYSHIKEAQGVLAGLKPDLVIAHDIETVPLVLRMFPLSKIILDAHEYAPRQFEDRFFWRLLIQPFKNYLCKRYMLKINASITVSQGIADEYEKQYGVKPSVITNAPFFHRIKARKTDPSKIRLIHHGITNPSRKIENMIRLIDHLDERFYLDLMLKASNYPQYLAQLKSMAADRKRVRLLEPVPMNSI
ncbi:MAG: glycosyltransferase family 4 protein, partial [Dethiobacteria bacterium]|nr:glycosyltransferase family 4 protein [Dethiobacteria bacterium]